MVQSTDVNDKAPQGALFVFVLAASAGLATLCWPGSSVLSAPHHEYTVIRHVIDGDSVVLDDRRQVRLIGINAPELGKKGSPPEPVALAAREMLSRLVTGKKVRIEYELEERDRHGRWLAHLQTANGENVEQSMLEAGLAFAIAIPPNIREHNRLFKAEQLARHARRGVWLDPYFAPREAGTLTGADAGFRRVRGRVSRIGRSRTSVYLDLAPRMSIRIRHADWSSHFAGRPESWLGANIEARGWIAVRDDRLHMTIGHPRMIERLN